jgi:hypothetical protein
MLAPKAFFSFSEIPDRAHHRAYNEWHQLDHRPENLALPGVLYGERWVRTPDCATQHTARSPLDSLHYVNVYWFTEPVTEAVRHWAELAERSLHWGRRPDLLWARRLLMGFFTTVKGYIDPGVLVSADVLPLRPNRGVYVTATEVTEPASPAADAYFAYCDRSLIPDVLTIDGVAGAWTFASDPLLGTNAIAPLKAGLRVQLYFLDLDPVAVAPAIGELTAAAEATHAGHVRDIYRGPLRTIVPWEYDWFDAPNA